MRLDTIPILSARRLGEIGPVGNVDLLDVGVVGKQGPSVGRDHIGKDGAGQIIHGIDQEVRGKECVRLDIDRPTPRRRAPAPGAKAR
jgi:hypothetical protein